MLPYRLEIPRLSLSLFVVEHKNIQGTPRNFPSIPPTTNLSTDLVGVSWRF
jgi:hypothetical protein